MLSFKEPEYVYYNSHAISTQNYSKGIKNDAIARINEDRTTPIINDISKYDLSIVRFDAIGLKDIPIFIPMIESGQSNPNKTVYQCNIKVRISDDNTGSESFETTENIIFEPQIGGLETPKNPDPLPDYNNEYYYVYTFSHMVRMINRLFQNCYETLQQSINNNATEPITINQKPPHVEFDASTKKFKIYFDSRGYGYTAYDTPTGSDAYFDISFNSNLYNILSNFTGFFTNGTDENYFTFLFPNDISRETITIDTITYIVASQENESLQLWSPASNIVFTTDIIPSLPEQISVNNLYGTFTERLGSNNDTEHIITDISLPLDNPYDVQNIAYVPSGEYRMINLNNSAGRDLKNINFALSWRNKYNGSLVPVKLSSGAYFTVKLMFRKKKLFIKN